MFTWVCPKCGGTVDVAEDACPHCAGRSSAAPDVVTQANPEPLGMDPQPVPAQPVQSLDRPDPRPASTPAVPEAAAPTPTPADQTVRRSRGQFEIQTKHMLVFCGAVVLAICVAIGMSAGPGGLFSALRLEDPEEIAASPVETFAIGVRGPIEVSGIRPYYDDDFQTHVRAFVANHSNEPQSVAVQVLLRVRQASSQALPIATFEVIISDPLPPQGGQEIDVRLAAMGSLQSLPQWDDIRVDIEALGAAGG